MGRSICNLATTWERLDSKKLEYQYGGTLFWPFWRYFTTGLGDFREVFGIDRNESAKEDEMGFLSVTVPGGGGSILGESFYNFGLYGMFLFFFLGIFIKYIDSYKYKIDGLYIVLLFFNAIIRWVRGYFYEVPFAIIINIIIFVVILVLDYVVCNVVNNKSNIKKNI